MNLYLIAGVINSMPNTVYFWLGNKNMDSFKIGDYAIVENLSSYDLVKIAGIVWTNEYNLKSITKVKDLAKMKKVIKYIPKEELENEVL